MEKRTEGFQGEKAIVTPYSVRIFQQRNSVTSNLYVTHVGYYPHAKFHFRDRPEGAAENILIYCLEGSGWIEIDQRKNVVSKKQAYIIPSGIPHVYAADKQEPWSIYWIHFLGNNSAYYAEMMMKVLDVPEGSANTSHSRVQLFESIFQNLENGYLKDNLEYSSICFQHFLASFLYTPQFNRLTNSEDQDIVYKSIAYMKENLDGKLTLKDIADSINYSPAYFSTVFKEKTHYSPIEYYNQLKIQRSCSLLQFTDLKIKEIAFKLGYYDAFHFSKSFAKEMEINPREYRKRYQ